VDITDLYALATHWQQPSGALWANGDFTDDGVVDASDLGVLAARWQSGAGGPSLLQALTDLGLPTDVVPEPGFGAIMVVFLAGLSQVRRRHRDRGRRDLPPVHVRQTHRFGLG